MLFGGKPLKDHMIPACFGAIEPTAVFVPLREAIKPEHFGTVCKEVFGPFQVGATTVTLSNVTYFYTKLQLILSTTFSIKQLLPNDQLAGDPFGHRW